jgi:phosphate transport system permease protein
MRKIRLVKDITARHFMLGIAVFTILFLLVIGFSLFFKALPIMKEKNLWVLLTSANWRPFKGDFGFLPYIISTVYVSLIAIIIALPFSILTSIHMPQGVSVASLNRLSIFSQAFHLSFTGYGVP